MFDSFTGLPLHALVVHAVVVAVPLSLLLAVMFVIPRFRDWARWALAVVAVGTMMVAIVARLSGTQLYTALDIENNETLAPLIDRHATLATQLVVILVIFAVLAVLSAFTVGSPRREGRGFARNKSAALALSLVMLVTAVVAMIWVARVGDLGSRAVWNPTGSQNYEVGN